MEEEMVEKKGLAVFLKVFVVLFAVVALAISVSFFVSGGNKEVVKNDGDTEKSSSDVEIPKIKNLGVNFEKYDSVTKMAGDFKFSKTAGFNNMIFIEFGYHIDNEMGAKDQPEITYHLPLKTKVMAIGDGKVTDVTKLYSNDYAILYTSNDNENWTYTNEHIINPTVKVGDQVKAGDIIGEVAPYEANGQIQELGFTEIAMFRSNNNKITKVCPTMHLDDEVSDKYHASILQLLSDWEEFMGDSSIYDELKYDQFAPGCLKKEVIEITE